MIESINHTTESDCCPAGLDSMASYKKKFESFGCFNPECKSGFDIEVHHIIPKSKGGKNEYYNYILLCFECHRKSKNHRSYHERRTALWTWKFYFESKHGDKSNLLVLPSGDPKAENRKREDSSEILQQEMQIELSQSTEKKEKPRSVRKGIKRSAPKASPLKRIICKTCNRDALVSARCAR